jgi:adenosine deaminase
MTVDVPRLARLLPKVELHCHLEGSARPATIGELARANGVELPTDDPAERFEFTDLDSFLAVYAVVGRSLVSVDDVRRVTERGSPNTVKVVS